MDRRPPGADALLRPLRPHRGHRLRPAHRRPCVCAGWPWTTSLGRLPSFDLRGAALCRASSTARTRPSSAGPARPVAHEMLTERRRSGRYGPARLSTSQRENPVQTAFDGIRQQLPSPLSATQTSLAARPCGFESRPGHVHLAGLRAARLPRRRSRCRGAARGPGCLRAPRRLRCRPSRGQWSRRA